MELEEFLPFNLLMAFQTVLEELTPIDPGETPPQERCHRPIDQAGPS